MKRIAIIGVGLIGASLGLALKSRPDSRRMRIIGAGRHEDKLKLAMKLGAIDAFTTDFSKAAMESDIIVICAPVRNIPEIVKKIARHIKPCAIVTDAGSVKADIVKKSEKALRAAGRKDVFFIGAHPMAGSEKTGAVNGSAELFKNATVALTPVRGVSSARALAQVKNMWKATGASVEIMSPEKHDEIAALTSHLPHALSAALVRVISTRGGKDPLTEKLIAGSFRDITRISDSGPANWADIFGLNSKNIISAINIFKSELDKTARLLRKNGSAGLKKNFEMAKKERCRLLKSNPKKK